MQIAALLIIAVVPPGLCNAVSLAVVLMEHAEKFVPHVQADIHALEVLVFLLLFAEITFVIRAKLCPHALMIARLIVQHQV